MAVQPNPIPAEADGESQSKPARPRTAGITPRALIIGVLLIPVLCLWTEYTEIVAQATDIAAMSLIIAVVFALFVLVLFNQLLQKFAPRWAFTQSELMYIYIMQTVSIGISGIGMMQFLNTFTGNIFHYGTPENKWKETFLPHIPHVNWLLPQESVTKAFYVGQSSFWTAENIAGWIRPILLWTGFITVLLWVMVCLNVLIRRQWMDQERLSFPITQLPLEISRDGGKGLFQGRALWIGFLIPVVLETLASLNYLYPSLPFFPIKPSDPRLDLTQVFASGPPWNGIGTLQLSFYPLVIGLTYFLPLDVGFSLWFFYLFSKFENVAAVGLGYHEPGASQALSRIPYVGEQSAGAYLGVALFALYGLRHHLKAAILKAFQPSRVRDVDDSNEPLPYRVALLGGLGGFALLVAFGISIGMSWWIPPIYFALYYLYVITFTRIRAEAGLPWGYGPDMNVHQLLNSAGGTQTFSMSSQIGLNLILWHDLDYRTTEMPNQLEAMKIGTSVRMNLRHVTAVIVLATVIGALASWGSVLTCYYQYGAASAKVNSWRTSMGSVPWQTLKNILDNPRKPDIPRMEGVGIGFVITLLLMSLRQRFTWWPFHPIGYAIAGTSTMGWIWCATLVGWLIKSLVIRYGGMKTYRQFIPFFIGLILGDYITGSAWAIYGSLLGIQTYRAFPI